MTDQEKKRFIKEEAKGKCEMCGSTRNLEVHHIVPETLSKFMDLNFDQPDNLLCLCSACHARLTPKSFLIKVGIQGRKILNERALNKCLPTSIYKTFYSRVEEKLNENDELTACDVMDVFDNLFEDKQYDAEN